jgi:hypothetical protein
MGDTVDRDAFKDETQPWRAMSPEDDGWLLELCG